MYSRRFVSAGVRADAALNSAGFLRMASRQEAQKWELVRNQAAFEPINKSWYGWPFA